MATEWTRKLQKKSSGKTVIRPDMTYKTILFDNEDTVLSLEDGTELLDDFDLWKERSDLELEKIMDRNYWSSTGGY